MTEEAVKACSKCKLDKLFSEFYKDRRGKDGIKKMCKECINRQQKIYKSSDKAKLLRVKQTQRNRNKNLLGVVITAKTCRRCMTIKPSSEFHQAMGRKDGLQSQCKMCLNRRAYNEAMKLYNKKRRTSKQVKAREAVHCAIKSGRLKKQPCIVCGAKAEAHHSDYSKPLDVDWLCRKHHALWHLHYKPGPWEFDLENTMSFLIWKAKWDRSRLSKRII